MQKLFQFYIILVLCILCVSGDNSSDLIKINLTDTYETFQLSDSYQYYWLEIQKPQQFLLITVDSKINTYIGIYISLHWFDSNQTKNLHPNDTSATQKCFYETLSTCAIQLKLSQHVNQKIEVYFSVLVNTDTNYTVQISNNDSYQIAVDRQYWIDFSRVESGVLKLPASEMQGFDQVIIYTFYKETSKMGKFSLMAGNNTLPTILDRINSISLGTYRQILKLPALTDPNASYYIVIEGENGILLSLQTCSSMITAPTIQMNQSISYIVEKQIAYECAFPYTTQQQQGKFLPMYIGMQAYTGYGLFQIEYCQGLSNYTFQNLNGENGEIIISSQQRLQCYKQKKEGLLLQNLIISINKVRYQFGYAIAIFEGSNEPIINLGQQNIGHLISTQNNRKYRILKLQQNTTLKLLYSNNAKLIFTLHECINKVQQINKCLKIFTSLQKNNSIEQMQYINFNVSNIKYYRLMIQHSDKINTTDNYYNIILNYKQLKHMYLYFDQTYYHSVEQNQYQYYIINLTEISLLNKINITNKTNIIFSLIQLNGQALLLSSFIKQYPNITQAYNINSNVSIFWSGYGQISINNTTELLYLSILGLSQCFYHLQLYLHVEEDLPISYITLVENVQNHFILTPQQTLGLKYTSHSIPYKIKFKPQPSCISYGQTLPLDLNCSSNIPTEFTTKNIYFKIMNQQSQLKFIVYVNSKQYKLTHKNPIMIACQSTCFQLISTKLLKDSDHIMHTGMGEIMQQNTNQTISNGLLNLSCDNEQYPCDVIINASLIYGGQMQITYQNTQSTQINYAIRSMSLNLLPKKLHMYIRSYSSSNSFIILSQAATLNTYYNIYSIQQNATNVMEYQFPSVQEYMGVVYPNPIHKIHIIQLNKTLLEQLSCHQINRICMLTVLITLNTTIQYNDKYIVEGIAHFSQNSYSYYLTLNGYISMIDYFDLRKFYYPIQDLPQNITINKFRVGIQVFSNCQPVIYYNNEYYYNQLMVPLTNDIKFDIMNDHACNYKVTFNTHNYSIIMTNVQYNLKTNSDGILYFVYQPIYTYSSGFTINIGLDSHEVKKIIALNFSSNQDGQLILPTQTNNNFYQQNTNNLFINSSSYFHSPQKYIIAIHTNPKTNFQLMIKVQKKPIYLLHEQKQSYIFKQNNQSLSFLFYTTGNFYIFCSTSKHKLMLNVTKNYGFTTVMSSQITTTTSQQFINVQTKSEDLIQYQLKITHVSQNNQNDSQTILNIYIQQHGTLGLPKLYEGIAYQDGFTSLHNRNCYQYTTDLLLGTSPFMLDLVLDANIIIPFQAIKLATKENNLYIKNDFKPISKEAYRAHIPYVPKKTYKLCFSITAHQLIGKQYHVIIGSPNMPHLALGSVTLPQQSTKYSIYQLISIHPQTYIVKLTKCRQTANLLGSSSYETVQSGKLSQLSNIWYNSDLIVTLLDVKQGYYYFGSSTNSIDALYSIQVDKISKQSQLINKYWKLINSQITKVFISNGQVQIQMPLISQIGAIKADKVVYFLNVLNITDAPSYHITVFNKCPQLLSKGWNIQQNITNPSLAIFKLPISNLSKLFNITGRVQVHAKQQILSYYYQSAKVQIMDSQSEKQNSFSPALFVVVLIGIILLTLIGGYLIYKKWKFRQQRARIEFQMTQFNEKIESNLQAKQHRQALNNKTDYGQFVDESS